MHAGTNLIATYATDTQTQANWASKRPAESSGRRPGPGFGQHSETTKKGFERYSAYPSNPVSNL